jgi:hypothetical protein
MIGVNKRRGVATAAAPAHHHVPDGKKEVSRWGRVSGVARVLLLFLLTMGSIGMGMIVSIYHRDGPSKDDVRTPVASNKRRFPTYGTKEFDQTCSWTVAKVQQNCTVYLSPGRTSEGLASWVALIVQVFLSARQAGCQVLVEYADVNLGEIMGSPDPQKFNWTTPSKFQCQQHEYCFSISTLRHMPHELLVEG